MQRLETVHIDTLSVTNFTPPASCIGNSQIVAGANIDAEKVGPQPRYFYSCDSTMTNLTGQPIGVIRGTTARIEEVIAGARLPCTATDSVRLRIKKGGIDVLSTAIVLTSAQAAYAAVDGTLSVTTGARDDVLTLDSTTVHHTGGVLASGVFVLVLVYEDAV